MTSSPVHRCICSCESVPSSLVYCCICSCVSVLRTCVIDLYLSQHLRCNTQAFGRHTALRCDTLSFVMNLRYIKKRESSRLPFLCISVFVTCVSLPLQLCIVASPLCYKFVYFTAPSVRYTLLHHISPLAMSANILIPRSMSSRDA